MIENITVKKTGHVHQTDAIAMMPLECLLIVIPQKPHTNVIETYLLMSNLWLDFLSKGGLNNKYVDFSDVHENVEKMTSEWLDYDIRYTS